jgi:hypothetical protein
MDSIISLLQDTPIPTILVVSGVVFLFLALAGQIAGKLEVPPTRQKWAAAAGALFLSVGLLLYLVPGLPSPSLAHGQPEHTLAPSSEEAAVISTNNLNEPVLAHETAASQTSLSAAGDSPQDGAEACLNNFFSTVETGRVVRVESGKSGKELLGAQQTKKKPAGILLVDLGQPILALTYSFVEEDELFKIGAVVDGACQPLDYANASRGGPRDVLENWDTLEVKREGTIYALRFGYYGGEVSLDTSEFQE